MASQSDDSLAARALAGVVLRQRQRGFVLGGELPSVADAAIWAHVWFLRTLRLV